MPRSGSGRGCWEENDLPAPSDHYRIGSITKTMTATVVWQLVQEGKVSLDDPISKYRPDVPNGDNITIAQLLDMRSGLAGYTEDPVFQRAVDEDHEPIWNPDELLARRSACRRCSRRGRPGSTRTPTTSCSDW